MCPGFVTTSRVTHATPAATFAHIPHREWECDGKLPANASSCKDIARQLVEDLPGRDLRVRKFPERPRHYCNLTADYIPETLSHFL